MNKPNFKVLTINGKTVESDVYFKITDLILNSLKIYDILKPFVTDINEHKSKVMELSFNFYDDFKSNYDENLGLDFINDLIDIFEKFTENYEEVLKLYAK